MDHAGEVVWELRPSSEERWARGLELARRLVALRTAAAEAEDPALAANLALLDAVGRDQRAKPALEELDRHAATAGAAAELVELYRSWRTTQEFERAVALQPRDGGAAAFALFRSGRRATGESGGVQFTFYRAALEGAIDAGDASRARELLGLWKAAASDPSWQEWTDQQVAKYRRRIDDIE